MRKVEELIELEALLQASGGAKNLQLITIYLYGTFTTTYSRLLDKVLGYIGPVGLKSR